MASPEHPPLLKVSALWSLARRSPNKLTRMFALGELICFPLSILTILALLVTAGLRLSGIELPTLWSRSILPLLCAGAIGYLTNYIAVRMLFEPYTRTGWHWLRILTFGLWRQGLVPTRKNELGATMGVEIGDKLLTPEAITEEMKLLAASAIDNEDFRKNLPAMVGPLLRDGIAPALEKLMPQLSMLLKFGISANLTNENLQKFVDQVAVPWVASPSNREQFANGMAEFLEGQSPRIVAFMKTAAEKYTNKAGIGSFLMSFAEGAGLLDWNEIGKSLHTELASEQSRQEIAKGIDGMIVKMQQSLERGDHPEALNALRDRAADFAVQMVGKFLEKNLPMLAGQLIDSPAFWQWMSNEGLPALKPRLLNWIDAHGVEVIGKRFDVAGRVKGAVEKMDIATVHAMVDNVATEQLGAIQVMGYVLGIMTGIPLIFLL